MIRAVVAFGILFVACAAFPTYTWPGYRNDNEAVRLYLTRALVEDHGIRIDRFLEAEGDTSDGAVRDGDRYTDKAQGLSFAATPLYAGLYHLGIVDPDASTMGRTRYLLSVTCVAVPVAVMLCLFALWARRLAAREWIPLLIGASLGLGTGLLPFAGHFMGHAFAAALAFCGFLCAWRAERSERAWAWFALAGALLGLCTFTDYFSAVITVALGIYVVTGPGRLRGAAAYAAGGIPALVAMLMYNQAAFGSPFTLGYQNLAFEAFSEVHDSGFLGLVGPSWDSIAGVLFTPRKGLLYHSPVLALVPLGFVMWWRSGKDRRTCVLFAASTAIYLLLIVSLLDWTGGYSCGLRHAIPVLPFTGAALVALFAHERSRWMAYVVVPLALIGVVHHLAAVLTFPDFPNAMRNPLFQLAYPSLGRGLLGPTVSTSLGLGAWASLVGMVLLASCVLAPGLLWAWRLGHIGPARVAKLAVLSVAVAATLWLLQGALGPAPSPVERYLVAHVRMLEGRTAESVAIHRQLLAGDELPPEIRAFSEQAVQAADGPPPVP